jgi:predicted PurR-regulated permease PerM
MGSMVGGTVKGQFVIAVCQGVAGAASIYIAGFHDGFFMFAILLSALSVIPLGGGILSIPFGIGMILFGNVIGGVFVIVFHIVVVTNIDNFLRPILVPRTARLDSALMLLAVFAGIAMFGAWGIVIGPVIMIVIVTTISVYLAVYKGVPIDQPDEDDKQPGQRRLLGWLTRRARRAAKPEANEPEPDKADAEASKPGPEANSSAP